MEMQGVTKKIHFIAAVTFLLSSCGLKVIYPNRPDTKGTLMVDYSGDTPKLVGTYTCTMVGGNGQRVFATDKTEESARAEVIKKCQDLTVISFCTVSRISCDKN